jgi:hypothetical protein
MSATIAFVMLGLMFAALVALAFFAGRDCGWRSGWKAGALYEGTKDSRMLARFDQRKGGAL